MDMDMESMNMDATPFNINEPYANTLAGILAGITLLLALRHWSFFGWEHWAKQPHTRNASACRFSSLLNSYQSLERYVINKCSYTTMVRGRPVLPPLGALLVVVALISALLPLLLVQTDLIVNSNRAGFLTIAIVPFLLSSTGKNSAIALLTGISPVRLNFLHRLLGLAIVVLATIHMACMISSWAKFPSFLAAQLSLTKVHYGLAGYGCLCVVVVGSLYPVRRYAYEVFMTTHVLSLGFLGAIAKHTPYAMRYFAAGLFCYVINLIVTWCIQSRIARVRLESRPDQCTRVLIRVPSAVLHTPGQYIYLCIPALSPFQWHPFTITSIQQDDTLEVHACVRGRYTRRLHHHAGSGEWPAFVSGPFGTSSDQLLPSTLQCKYDTVALMTAGAGVTFGIRLLRELASQCGTFSGRTRDIYFGWSVRHQGELAWFHDELNEVAAQFAEAQKLNHKQPHLHVHLHVTGVHATTDDIEEKYTGTPLPKAVEQEVSSVAPAVTLGSRIDAHQFLQRHGATRLGLFVCGPASFNAAFKNAVASQSPTRASGIHLHTENFEY